MISQMLLLISLANSFGVQAGASVWFRVGTHAQCDVSQGEKYLAGSSGSVADRTACKQSCDDEDDCRTVTYFGKSKWCSHFSTACKALLHSPRADKVVVYHSSRADNEVSYAKSGTAPPTTTAYGVVITIAWQQQISSTSSPSMMTTAATTTTITTTTRAATTSTT